MDMAFRTLPTEMSTKGTTYTVNRMEKEIIFGLMEPAIKESFLMGSGKVMELGLAKMEINMLDISVMIERMVLANTSGQMVIAIRETFAKIWDKVKARCFGMMEVLILENGKGAYHTEKVVMCLTKSGIFKVKGEKPRVGYF